MGNESEKIDNNNYLNAQAQKYEAVDNLISRIDASEEVIMLLRNRHMNDPRPYEEIEEEISSQFPIKTEILKDSADSTTELDSMFLPEISSNAYYDLEPKTEGKKMVKTMNANNEEGYAGSMTLLTTTAIISFITIIIATILLI